MHRSHSFAPNAPADDFFDESIARSARLCHSDCSCFAPIKDQQVAVAYLAFERRPHELRPDRDVDAFGAKWRVHAAKSSRIKFHVHATRNGCATVGDWRIEWGPQWGRSRRRYERRQARWRACPPLI